MPIATRNPASALAQTSPSTGSAVAARSSAAASAADIPTVVV